MDEKSVLKEFRKIPGVGPTIAKDFWNLGFRTIEEFKGKDPEVLYKALCKYQGCHVDRCMLYVFRLTVYYASTKNHEPEKLKWWNWK